MEKAVKTRLINGTKKKEFWGQSKVTQEDREVYIKFKKDNPEYSYQEMADFFGTTKNIITYAVNYEKRKESARIAMAKRRELGLIDHKGYGEYRKKRRQEIAEYPEFFELKDMEWYDKKKKYQREYMSGVNKKKGESDGSCG